MKRVFNILFYAFLAACTTGLAVAGVAYFLLSASVPDYNEDFSLAGINGPVEILRDSAAVPHISAASAADVYFAIGFVHAQDRLGQLLRARRMAGDMPPPGGMAELDPSTSDALKSYAAGVNAWLGVVAEGGRGRGAPEQLISGGRTIASWRPEDSLMIARSFLSTLQPEGGRQGPQGASALPLPEGRPVTPELFAALPGASLNAWALSGNRTATGAPILAADISGSLALPSEWYLADLQLPTGATIGVTLPGVPFVVVGRSERVAWALRSVARPGGDAPEALSMSDAGNFLTLLDRFAQTSSAVDAVRTASGIAPSGLGMLAIDRETLGRWPEGGGGRPRTFREARLAVLDDRQPVFSVESAIAVQRDTVSSAARSLLPLMARELWFVSPPGAPADGRIDTLRGEVLNRLTSWNGDMDRFSPEPLIFWTWVRSLQQRILQDEFPGEKEVWARPNPDFLYAVLSDRGGRAIWCDIRPSARLETCQDQVLAALNDALGRLADLYGPDPSAWAWGEEHSVIMEWSPIRLEGLAEDLLALEASVSGAPYTQASTFFAWDDELSFKSKAGTNFQAVMSLSEEAGSYFIAPAGQSGHPLSQFFDNLFSMWMRGEYLVMSTDLALARGGAVGTSRLTPISAGGPTLQKDGSS